ASAQGFLVSLGPDRHGLSQETPSLLRLCDVHGPPPALVFSCQTGVGRTNLGMILGTLILLHHSGTTSQP
ncbi:Paladin, partial [Saguinus oedipus]